MGSLTVTPLLPLKPINLVYEKYMSSLPCRVPRRSRNLSLFPVARLFGPAIFEASKLKVLFLGVDDKKHPGKLPRTYTLTHSDITSKITLAISQSINNSQLPSKSTKLCSLSLPLQLLYLGPDKKILPAPTPPSSAPRMDTPISDHRSITQNGVVLPELLTEFMVDMKCESCVNAVKSKLLAVDGVKNVEVDLSNQVVRILSSSPVRLLTEALEQTGRSGRLIGQGIPEDFIISAAVAEFKGPNILGVVRLAQANMDLARVEASFSGLSPGKHGWSINEFGDLTRGPASTGKVFSPPIEGLDQPLGDLGTLEADGNGDAFYSGAKSKLRVANLIGRSIVVYETENRSDSGITAAVVARSAGVGENYKKLCACDGTTIWESSNLDLVSRKV
ncbi:hypothetical protein SAY87_014455 [Trapa incisa]|uniref:Superoxide dismutase copper chaperone n=1 Tax=Trapa incisa TaxID=236973 RepID=A0AAN7GZZ0_9MYRT|nr:hypothetical protein SAY87_014455 [Trapa incisa]